MDHEADAHRTDLMTITRHVLNEQSRYPESRGDFTILLSHIVLGCKFVASAVSKVTDAHPVARSGAASKFRSLLLTTSLRPLRSELKLGRIIVRAGRTRASHWTCRRDQRPGKCAGRLYYLDGS